MLSLHTKPIAAYSFSMMIRRIIDSQVLILQILSNQWNFDFKKFNFGGLTHSIELGCNKWNERRRKRWKYRRRTCHKQNELTKNCGGQQGEATSGSEALEGLSPAEINDISNLKELVFINNVGET